MNEGNTGLLFAVGSMIFMGISSFLYKRSTDAIGATNTTFYYYLFSIVIATLVWLIFREKQAFSKSLLLWPFLIAVFLFLSVWFFNLSLRHIEISTAATIRGLFFIITTVLAVTIAKEQPSPMSMVAMGFAVIAVALLGFDASSKGGV
jgi:drug/metabolite transporter (DMT)-like permease